MKPLHKVKITVCLKSLKSYETRTEGFKTLYKVIEVDKIKLMTHAVLLPILHFHFLSDYMPGFVHFLGAQHGK